MKFNQKWVIQMNDFCTENPLFDIKFEFKILESWMKLLASNFELGFLILFILLSLNLTFTFLVYKKLKKFSKEN